MPLEAAVLESLAHRGAITEADAAWLRQEQQKEQEACAGDDSVASFGLFATASDSDSDGDEDELQRQTWSCQATVAAAVQDPEEGGDSGGGGGAAELRVGYHLALNAAFGHGDEVWMAAVCLAQRLCDRGRRAELLGAELAAGRVGLAGLKVLELGAGSGIPTAVCYKLGATAVGSDYPTLGAVRALVRSALSNTAGEEEQEQDGAARGGGGAAAAALVPGGSMHIAAYLWGSDPAGLLQLVGANGTEATGTAAACGFDIAIAADCIYDPSSHAPLLESCAKALRPGGLLLLSFSLHGNVDEVAVFGFLPKARRAGFVVAALEPISMHAEALQIRSRQGASAHRSVVYTYRLTYNGGAAAAAA
eukprot:SAG22_NODE_1758_length_3640_cov_1.779723_1_plen_362_part_10